MNHVHFNFKLYDIGGKDATADDGKLTGEEVKKAKADGWNVWEEYSQCDHSPLNSNDITKDNRQVSNTTKNISNYSIQELLSELKYKDAFLNNVYKLSAGKLRIDGRGFEDYTKDEQNIILQAHKQACNETGYDSTKPPLMGTTTVFDGTYFPTNYIGSMEGNKIERTFGL